MDFNVYLREVESNLRSRNATEHTYRGALEELINSLSPDIHATNEPKRTSIGAPDYVVSRRRGELSVPIGYIEAKDVGADLGHVERSGQMQRYLRSLPNLILTDYLEFHWYLDGVLRQRASLATVDARGRVVADRYGPQAVRELLDSFLAQAPPRSSNPRELAVRMAELTHTLRDLVLGVLQREGEQGTLHSQMLAFQKTLLPELRPEEFADMYAQTVAYGLFAARAAAPTAAGFSRQSAAQMLPRSNPFLRRFFNEIAGYYLDEQVAWVVDALAALLQFADMEAVLRDFGRRTRREDPVVHFYETFLKEYDPRTREMRGVYYTPEPVVSYIVRSVESLLRSVFGKTQGLADLDTLVLDPALGTGTFLYTLISHVHERMVASGNRGGWNSYVSQNLLRRVFGFELLIAPYTVAHLKLELLLAETGYRPQPDDPRLGVYLTNTLAEGIDSPPLPFAEHISDEANAATAVKRAKPIMVVLGNPPYSGHSANKGEWIGDRVRDYYFVDGRPLGERNPKWLQDDYVKFIRFGQWRIDETGHGVLAFITNHGYLDNPTFRGMRRSLMNSFSRIYVLDLHGNSKKRERTPDGGPDENVFDIQQGVAIGLFVKESGHTGPAKVYHADLWGAREAKYEALAETDVESTSWTELSPTAPFYMFIPRDTDLLAEYEQGWNMSDAIPVWRLGPNSHRDHFAISFDKMPLANRVGELIDPNISDEELYRRYKIADNRDWTLSEARRLTQQLPAALNSIVRCIYRPFDFRYMIYGSFAFDYPRPEVNDHLLRPNICLITTRQTREPFSVLASDVPAGQHKLAAVYDGSYLFPLYLYPDPGQSSYHRADAVEAARKAILARQSELGAAETQRRLSEVTELVHRLYPKEEYPRWPNLAPEFLAEVEARTGLRYSAEGSAGRGERILRGARNDTGSAADVPSTAGGTFTPEDVFHYIYAVLHSPTYRSRYAQFLKSDFPRVPLTSDAALFRDLAALGARLVALHLLRAPELSSPDSGFPETGTNEVEQVRYDEAGERVFINRTQHFTRVPPEVWEFHIGGYQVAEKWLKDRKGRRLTYDDISHYERTLAALAATISLMSAVDERIPAWPLA